MNSLKYSEGGTPAKAPLARTQMRLHFAFRPDTPSSQCLSIIHGEEYKPIGEYCEFIPASSLKSQI